MKSQIFLLLLVICLSAQAAQALEIFHGEKSFLSETNQLLAGSHWVRKTKRFVMQTPYGIIESTRGDFFADFEGTSVHVVNHLGELKVTLRDGSVVQIPPGFEFWFSELKADKKNKMGFLEPVELKDHIFILGKMWQGNQKAFKQEMLKLQSHWGDRVGLAARYYKSLAQRKIASYQRQENEIQNRKRQAELRREANRKLLFERAFGR
jgi:hypothetical protein